jgi:hypothetical protein
MLWKNLGIPLVGECLLMNLKKCNFYGPGASTVSLS